MRTETQVAVFAAFALAGGVAAVAQQRPVFRSAVDVVTIDATVVDRQGSPVPGLGPADFRLEVDGAPRRIASVQFVSLGGPRRPAAAAPTGQTDASTNEFLNDGRLVMVAVDQANIRRLEGRAAVRAAGEFLDALPASDRVAVASVNYAGDLSFSTDRARARRQLEQLSGESDMTLAPLTFNVGLAEALAIADGGKVRLDQAVKRECGQSLGKINDLARVAESEGLRDPCPTQLEQEARVFAQQVRTRASISLSELQDMIARLKTIDEPKVLVLLSEGLIAEPNQIDLTALGAAAQEARVTIYVLQLDAPLADATSDRISPTMTEDIRLRADGLARLAGAARGALFPLVGGDSGPFERISRELSGYYLVAFEPEPADRDGRTHKINLSLTRGGSTLRAREAFRLPPATSQRALTEKRILELLKSGKVATELPLRASTYSYYDPASGKVRVEIGAETETDDVLFAYVLIDGRGVIAASQAVQTVGRFLATATVDPGVYTLKVAAIDRFGRAGSLPRAVLAGLAKTALPASELMVSRVPAAAAGSAVPPLDPILDATSDRRVLAYIELYPAAGRSLAAADVILSLRPMAGGPAIVTMPAAISTLSPRVGVATAVLAVGDVPAGRYVMRAEIKDADVTVGAVERVFSIVR